MCDMLMDGARHIVAQSNIDAKRITARSGNEKRAAQSALAEFNQSLGNRRIMEAAGRQADDIEGNLARNLDAAAYGKLGARVGAAEELGSSAVDAAAAGVGGSSVESYNDTLRLHAEMAEEQGDRQVAQETAAASQSRADAISNGVAGVGRNSFQANLDFSQFVDDHKMSALTKIVGVGAAAAATYFGGPQAGKAVMSMVDARQRAQNGDFAGAERKFGAALDAGYDGFQTWRAGADDTHAGKAWGASAFGAKLKI